MFTKKEIKHSGATFTPKRLAEFLAKRIQLSNAADKVQVLDPACGEGELLLAIGECLTEAGIEFHLTGYDANAHYLNTAGKRLLFFGESKFSLNEGDFLQLVDIPTQASSNPSARARSEINNSFDIVVANPPYVRTQILGSDRAQELANKFGLKGRVDLYYPFLIAMTESLKEGAILGVITSNRFLFTKSGDSIRKYLSEKYSILELLDLGDTKLFDAAVLPAIFIGRRENTPLPATATFSKIYEELNGYNGPLAEVNSIYDVINDNRQGFYAVSGKRYKKTTGLLKYSANCGAPWIMLSAHETEWVKMIDRSSKFKVEDFFKVRVGIKTTADKVFISDAWDSLGDERPEEELLKELISQENIKGWGTVENSGLKVLYPHYSSNGNKKTIDLRKYPRARKYFIQHEKILKRRKYLVDSGREWFEIWVPHRPELWSLPKLVFPDISAGARFYFDRAGRVVNGNCYWIVAQSDDDIRTLLLIQGIANSKLMTNYHDLVYNNKLYSGRRRYLTQYVEKYPLPDPASRTATDIIEIVKQLNSAQDVELIKSLTRDLEHNVALAYNVDPVLSMD